MDDMILDSGNSMTIYNGDFVVDESIDQNIKLICEYDKGWLKQFPKLGIGMESMINGVLDSRLKNKIQAELKLDGIKIKEIYTDVDGNVKIGY